MRTAIMIIVSMAFVALARPAAAQDSPGKAVYTKSCASCHGADGKGNEAKAKALKIDPASLNLGRDEVAGQSKADKRAVTAAGKNKMPAYEKKLSAEELDQVSDYVMTLIEAIRKK